MKNNKAGKQKLKYHIRALRRYCISKSRQTCLLTKKELVYCEQDDEMQTLQYAGGETIKIERACPPLSQSFPV